MLITWWGHSTALVQLGGMRVLTDPVLTARVAHLVRQSPPPPTAAADVDIVVISHLHADHLHLPSLRRLPERVRVVAPRGTAALLARSAPALAARVEEVRPGDGVRVGAVEIRATPASHDGHRLPRSRFQGPALGYVLAAPAERVWFAGDTGLFDGLADIGPVDAALVPVGGWGPTLGPQHLDPEQAAEAVRLVGAADAVPVHYGTLWPIGLRRLAPRVFATRFREPGRLFAAALAASGTPARAHVLGLGASIELSR